jgi:hypothetical protein
MTTSPQKTALFLAALLFPAILTADDTGAPFAENQPNSSTKQVDLYNYVLGTQTFAATYQFTGQTRLVETAEAIRALGSSVIKFELSPKYAWRGYATPNPSIQSLAQLVHDEPSFRHVLEMPFANYVLWMHTFSNPGPESWRRGFPKEKSAREYHEVYDLVSYLLKTYSGTGKTFYLGHWEGDGWLRGSIKREDDVKATPVAIQGMIDYLTVRQQAVDDAKRDTPHHDVQVWHYTEVNHVTPARDEDRPTVVNKVLPHVPVDFVSYSSYDTTNSPRPDNIKSALDYIESKLTPKPGIPGKRVFIGEYGYPLRINGKAAHTPAEQERLSRIVMRTGLEWGCPFVLYWELYNNEVEPDGTQRGFWMIDEKGVKQPVCTTMQEFLAWARGYTSGVISKTGHPPTPEAYRAAAIGYFNALEPKK